ncbi:MAG: hypothetical protein DRJ37_06520 [Thermoprotei archaeon]|nr:MAG: hypothetical protein DRJ37_06520 [Thermoprotei archaeon]
MECTKELKYLMKFWSKIEELLDAKKLGRRIGYMMLNEYQSSKERQIIKFKIYEFKVVVLLNNEEIAVVETETPQMVAQAIREGILSIWLSPKPPKTIYFN